MSAYEESTSGTGGGIHVGPPRAPSAASQSTSYMAVDLRVVDTTTSEVSSCAPHRGRQERVLRRQRGHPRRLLGGREKTPAGKAIRACIIEIVDYLQCVMVDRDACMQTYGAKEQRRREKTKGAIKLDD